MAHHDVAGAAERLASALVGCCCEGAQAELVRLESEHEPPKPLARGDVAGHVALIGRVVQPAVHPEDRERTEAKESGAAVRRDVWRLAQLVASRP
eukprot:1966330-Prymnesium_polylepis.2